MSNPNNVFCRDVGTNGAPLNQQDLQTQVVDALGFAYAQLKNAYGDETVPNHMSAGAACTPSTSRSSSPDTRSSTRNSAPGPTRPGGAWTVDVGAPTGRSSSLLSFAYGSGGNVRWLAAMDGTVDHTFMQLPGVESGGPYPFGRQTMLTDWVLNQYFNWPHNAADVTSVRSETFSP